MCNQYSVASYNCFLCMQYCLSIKVFLKNEPCQRSAHGQKHDPRRAARDTSPRAQGQGEAISRLQARCCSHQSPHHLVAITLVGYVCYCWAGKNSRSCVQLPELATSASPTGLIQIKPYATACTILLCVTLLNNVGSKKVSTKTIKWQKEALLFRLKAYQKFYQLVEERGLRMSSLAVSSERL